MGLRLRPPAAASDPTGPVAMLGVNKVLARRPGAGYVNT